MAGRRPVRGKRRRGGEKERGGGVREGWLETDPAKHLFPKASDRLTTTNIQSANGAWHSFRKGVTIYDILSLVTTYVYMYMYVYM